MEKVLASLGLNDSEYCVVGGAVSILGIRPSMDVDLLVIPEAFDRVAKSHALKVTRSFRGSERLAIGNWELFKDDGFGKSAEEWIANSQVIDGVRIGSIKDLIVWKKNLMSMPGRKPEKIPQDHKDIAALEKLLKD